MSPEPASTVVSPSVFVIDRSARGVSVSLSVAELFAELVSVTPAGVAMLAVLTSEPVALGDTATVTV